MIERFLSFVFQEFRAEIPFVNRALSRAEVNNFYGRIFRKKSREINTKS